MDIREDLRYRGVFTKVPGDPSQWRRWEAMGRTWIRDCRRRNGGRSPQELTCNGGEGAFPRFFQLLAPGGSLTFRGSMEGFHFTFMGKRGSLSPLQAFEKAGFRRGESILVHYGVKQRGNVDSAGMEAIVSALDRGGIVVVATATEEQRRFVEKRWKGDIAGALSVEGLKQTSGFDWPAAMPVLPDPGSRFRECQEALTLFHERTVKRFRKAALVPLGLEEHPENGFDLVYERAGQDTLGISVNLVRPGTGRVMYGEEMAGRRYSFYAPHVWMNRRRIVMPSALIIGEIPAAPEREHGRRTGGFLPEEAEQLVRKLEPVGMV
ncbi:hypothetical protein C8P63_1511 [Melghirimyces profundicolus]|uniref:Uncharacterized protein n=1 Tax=Melghirimyces profundicolus TaxID=1242148 RepID=A0A2T6AUK2_9BACL|nr:hypothetical protein [Melghirimyces profundicolus]PTX47504.1 hypothetical protein C8P63_1511 [Melghirimyces profundicolus]